MLKEEILKVLTNDKGKTFIENELMRELKKSCEVVTMAGLKYCLKSLVEEGLIQKQEGITGISLFYVKNDKSKKVEDNTLQVYITIPEYKSLILQILSNGGKLTVVDIFCRIHRVYPQGKQCEKLFSVISDLVKEGALGCNMQIQGVNAGKFLYFINKTKIKHPLEVFLELIKQVKDECDVNNEEEF